MSSSYRIELENWLSQLDVDAERVLDIGGSQLPVKDRTRSWKVRDYFIGDLEEPHIGSPAPQIVIDLNQPQQADGQMKFDLIFCLEVMEYIWNPSYALYNINDFLKPGGTAWVTFPSFYPMHQPVNDDCLRYMPGGIRKLADDAALKIAQMIPRRPETNALRQFFAAERLRAAKGEDHDFTGWIVELVK